MTFYPLGFPRPGILPSAMLLSSAILFQVRKVPIQGIDYENLLFSAGLKKTFWQLSFSEKDRSITFVIQPCFAFFRKEDGIFTFWWESNRHQGWLFAKEQEMKRAYTAIRYLKSGNL